MPEIVKNFSSGLFLMSYCAYFWVMISGMPEENPDGVVTI
jgi:hypothetical protein